jgi:Tfp pilus assembly protein PilZ
VVRINLSLGEASDWVKVFDPRDQTVFVETDSAPATGTTIRIDLAIADSGPRVILRGQVIARRDGDGSGGSPAGCTIALGANEREKVNYLNGFVRGGLLNLRERRRLPLRLAVTYGGINGPVNTVTRDINEEGMFIVSESPLPEGSELHILLDVPGQPQRVSLTARVGHTVLVEDEDIPGMGVVFTNAEGETNVMIELVDMLEKGLLSGTLPDTVFL